MKPLAVSSTFLFEPVQKKARRPFVVPTLAQGTMSGEVGVPDQDVLEQELEELLRCVHDVAGPPPPPQRPPRFDHTCALSVWRLRLAGTMRR